MKPANIILLIAILVLGCPVMTFAEGTIPIYTDVDTVLNAANSFIKENCGIDKYFTPENKPTMKKINRDMALGKWWGTTTKRPVYMFVYGQPFGETKIVSGGTRNRYLGYTMMDEEFPNMFFPDDTELSSKYDERTWIENPWDCTLKESVSGKTLLELCSVDKRFDSKRIVSIGKPSGYYRNSIIYGMGICYGLCLDPSILEQRDIEGLWKEVNNPSVYPKNTKLKGDYLKIPWENYVHIIQPPTNFSWGIGRIWRKEGNTCNYLTIPMAPFSLLPDENTTPAASIWAPKSVKVGEPIQVTAQGTDKDNDKMTHYFSVTPETGVKGFIPDKSVSRKTIDGVVFYNTGHKDVDIPGLTALSGTVTASIPGKYTFKYMVVDEKGASAMAEAVTEVLPANTPKPSQPKPTPTVIPPEHYDANIVASASVYYVSDPGVDSIKSGYGFRLEVDTDVVVSPKPKETDPKPTGAKKATAYFLGKAYPMEIKSSSGTAVSFYLPKDTNSVTNARKIYIPAKTPDGTYDIAIYIEGASYDGKSVSKTIYKSITVKGNMYEDDYTGPKD